MSSLVGVKQLEILFEYSWDSIDRQADKISLLWESMCWILKDK